MEHQMNLDPEPFSKIRDGSKTVELRLYDEKRRRISPGDTIRFTNARRPEETVLTRVQALEVFPSFAELYGALPLLECGYTPETVESASPADMERYYAPELQARWGVAGIRVRVISR